MNEIGTLHWDACNTCIHASSETGECDVDSKIESHLVLDYDFILCGLYEGEE